MWFEAYQGATLGEFLDANTGDTTIQRLSCNRSAHESSLLVQPFVITEGGRDWMDSRSVHHVQDAQSRREWPFGAAHR
eukprot:1194797-Rhodomonas_salina.1